MIHPRSLDNGTFVLRRRGRVLDQLMGREMSVTFEGGVVNTDTYWDNRTPDWTSNPLMRLRWAVLEDWIWDYLQGKAEIDVEAMRELVEMFPKLPEDLPEKLLALSHKAKRAMTARGTGTLVHYQGSLMSRDDRSRDRQRWTVKHREGIGRRDQKVGSVTPGLRRPYAYRRKSS